MSFSTVSFYKHTTHEPLCIRFAPSSLFCLGKILLDVNTDYHKLHFIMSHVIFAFLNSTMPLELFQNHSNPPQESLQLIWKVLSNIQTPLLRNSSFHPLCRNVNLITFSSVTKQLQRADYQPLKITWSIPIFINTNFYGLVLISATHNT